MAVNHPKWKVFGPFLTVVGSSILASLFVSAERSLKQEYLSRNSTWVPNQDPDFLSSSVNFLWQADKSGYQHVWPSYRPRPFLKVLKRGRKRLSLKWRTSKRLETDGEGKDEAEYKFLQGGPSDNSEEVAKDLSEAEVKVIDNVRWKEFGLLVFVWVSYLALQITKNYTSTCSVAYWVVNLMQIPVSFGVSGYQAISLHKGWRKIESKGDEGANLQVLQLITYGFFGVMAGIVGGLLGLGGGFIMSPVFLELGIPPQVASATATFGMMFSSSMSVVEYYLLKRFPVPYALYFIAVATVAAFVGQHAMTRLVTVLGRASVIIFILSFTIFVSAL